MLDVVFLLIGLLIGYFLPNRRIKMAQDESKSFPTTQTSEPKATSLRGAILKPKTKLELETELFKKRYGDELRL